MRIGYDITAISAQPSGVGNYAGYLLHHMVEAEPHHEYLLLSNRPAQPALLPSAAVARPAVQPFPSRALWMQLALPRGLRGLRPDLCHYPNSLGPLLNPCPYVVTIHDMTLSLLPQHHKFRTQLVVRPLIPLVARRAQRVITVSEHARQDVIRVLRIPAERVVAIPEAAAALFRPAPAADQARVRARYRLDRPYILYVGTLEPRKNLVRLIRAWHGLRRSGQIEHALVLTGARGWKDQAIFDTVRELGCADEVVFTGYVPRADLPALYSGAALFAFPSLSEGFGLPVVEAMACGAPVLISTAPALAEVAGDAAVQVDPASVAAIAAGLGRVLNDPALGADLRGRGLRRAASFSWQAAAQQTLEMYRSALASVQSAGDRWPVARGR
ncbi:MAG TPA: glycosyltransferase family 1 protein [Herpetosiphonaceae bacterium]|nr:glycosyltransferase family 1 protein [Herpetosiphonaceae bacterium]